MTPGIAVIIGILIGAIIVYVLMQPQIKQKENALQRSRSRLDQLEREQEQRLSEVAQQLEADYEQKLAEKIERYQDKHAQQIEDLEAEYEARLAVLAGFDEADATSVDTTKVTSDGELGVEGFHTDTSVEAETIVSEADEPADLRHQGVGLGGAAIATMAAATVLPDPWDEQSAAAAEVITVTPDLEPTDNVAHEGVSPNHQNLASISETLATNRRNLRQVLPTLSKLSKDPDPAVRLATVQVLKQIESIQAIPLLRQALRDPNSDVVAAASEALARFKGTPKPTPSSRNPTQKKLPKNQ